MINIVNGRREQSGHNLQRCKYRLQGWRVEQDVGGLGHVSSVDTVVIWNIPTSFKHYNFISLYQLSSRIFLNNTNDS